MIYAGAITALRSILLLSLWDDTVPYRILLSDG